MQVYLGLSTPLKVSDVHSIEIIDGQISVLDMQLYLKILTTIHIPQISPCSLKSTSVCYLYSLLIIRALHQCPVGHPPAFCCDSYLHWVTRKMWRKLEMNEKECLFNDISPHCLIIRTIGYRPYGNVYMWLPHAQKAGFYSSS